MNASDRLRIGKILGVHGLHGRLKVFVITDIPERFEPGSTVMIGTEAVSEARTVEEFHLHKGRLALVRLSGIEDRDAAHALTGKEIFIDLTAAEEARDSLDDDSFFYYDLVGCAVFRDGKKFGTVMRIMEAGSGNILVIAGPKDREYLVPFVKSMVDTSELAKNRIDINPIEGLLD